jgi:hypothetical protein
MKRHDLKAFREMKMYPLCPNWDTCSSFSAALRCWVVYSNAADNSNHPKTG